MFHSESVKGVCWMKIVNKKVLNVVRHLVLMTTGHHLVSFLLSIIPLLMKPSLKLAVGKRLNLIFSSNPNSFIIKTDSWSICVFWQDFVEAINL